MNVPVGNFFRRRLAYVNDLHVKVQLHTRKGVVAVDDNIIALDALDHDSPDIALRILGLESHSGLNGIDALKGRDVNLLKQLGLGLTVAVLWRNADLHGRSGSFANQSALQARDNIARTMQVAQGLGTFGTVNDVASVKSSCSWRSTSF